MILKACKWIYWVQINPNFTKVEPLLQIRILVKQKFHHRKLLNESFTFHFQFDLYSLFG